MNVKMLATMALVIAIAFAAWTLFTRSSSAAEDFDVIIPEFSDAAQAGTVAYEKYCADCHGVNAIGSDKGPPLLHAYYKPGHHGDISFSNAALVGVRAHHWPFGDMPPVEGITDADIEIIIQYVRELQAANGF